MLNGKTKREQAISLFEIISDSIQQYGLRTTKAALNCVATDPTGAEDGRAAHGIAASFRKRCRDVGIQRDVIQWGQMVMSKYRRSQSMPEILARLRLAQSARLEV